jgi:hypothetical protein
MFRLDVDFAFSDTVQQVLGLIRKHRGKIVYFDPTGPGGGNPNILLSFDTQEEALAFLREHSPDDTDTFLLSRITPLKFAGNRIPPPLRQA